MSRRPEPQNAALARRGARGTFALGALAIVALACGTDPSSGNYTINFPSVAAAVATDAVQLNVFDTKGQDPRSFCSSLLLKVKSNQDLGTRLVTGPAVGPCDLAAGAKPVTISYGDRAILAVGTRGGKTLLAGCTEETVGSGSLPASIDLGIVDTGFAVPSTTCTRLSDFCSNLCK
jgi:hypothetical protein